jgi:hypothetical protein
MLLRIFLWASILFVATFVSMPFIWFLSLKKQELLNGLVVVYSSKDELCKNLLKKYENARGIQWIDIAHIPLCSVPSSDTAKMRNGFTRSSRVMMGGPHSLDAANWNFFVSKQFKFNNFVPHCALMQDGVVVQCEQGFPNAWLQ